MGSSPDAPSLARRDRCRTPVKEAKDMKSELYETVVIGGGQAGLCVGYHLAQAGRSFVILESNGRVGDSWRKRWDSLRLFTPAELNGLPGLRYPGRNWTFPTKDEMGDFLEAYANKFRLPVRTGVSVQRLSKTGDRFLIETAQATFEADNVVVASGADHVRRIPDFALDLEPRIMQLHSSEYRNSAMLRPGKVLVVGAGNSGAEIALDVARTHKTLLSGRYRRSPGGPSRSPIANLFIKPIMLHVITIDTPLGRKVRAAMQKGGGGAPVERVTLKALGAAGVELVARMESVRDGEPVLADGAMPDIANVIWCTGFTPGLEWIDLPVHDERGEARHVRGVSSDVSGLYLIGRPFQYSFISAAVGGVGRDAGYVAKQIVRHAQARASDIAGAPVRA
jgi:putative flavoprotein involved in K+ transport